MKKILFTTVFSCLIMATGARADMFTLHLIQGSSGINEVRGFTSIIDLFDQYEDGSLDSIINGYDKTSAADGWVNFRGIPMELRFDNAAVLTFNVPAADIHNMTFDGGSQEASFRLLKDYLEKNQDDLLKKILKASVQDTPYDLVAGNPNSMMATMADSAFQRAGGGVLGNFSSYISPNASRHHFKFQGVNRTADVYSLPLAKTFKFGQSGWALMMDLPIIYSDVDGSKSYAAQFGLGLKMPLINNNRFKWNLVPAARIGAIGSKDMLSGGLLYNGTLTSDMQVPVGSVTFGMTNMAGYIKDFSVKVADYDIEYDLENYVFKNGGQIRWDFAEKWAMGTAYSYTFYTGSDLFIDSYHDVGISLIRKFEEDSFFSGVALVGNYAFDGEDYYAYRMGINILF